MSEKRVTIELSLDELQKLQSAVKFFLNMKNILGCFESSELHSVDSKLDACIGTPWDRAKREEIEANIRYCLKDDPEGLSYALGELNKDYPLPEGYQQ